MNPDYALSFDLSANDDWLELEQPTHDVGQIVLGWIAALPDRPWRSPSQAFGLDKDPRYDHREVRLAGTDGVAIIYTVDEVTGVITIDAVGRDLELPAD